MDYTIIHSYTHSRQFVLLYQMKEYVSLNQHRAVWTNGFDIKEQKLITNGLSGCLWAKLAVTDGFNYLCYL